SWPAPPIGASSVSMAMPSRRNAAMTFAASWQISGPMPSPGSNAIFKGSDEPRLLPQVLRFEAAYGVGVLQRQRDVVESVDEAMLAERLDVECVREREIGCGDDLALDVDQQLVAGKRGDLVEQPVDDAFRQHDRQEADLVAVVVEDVGIRRR